MKYGGNTVGILLLLLVPAAVTLGCPFTERILSDSSGAGGTGGGTGGGVASSTSKSTSTSGSSSSSSAGGTGGAGGAMCMTPQDCMDTPMDCKMPTCTVGVCGASNEPKGTPCSVNGGMLCDGAGQCVPPSCMDGQKNGTETDTDCGGGCPNKCNNGKGCMISTDCTSGVCTNMVCQVPTCTDMVKNQDETDVDCGGSTCPNKCLVDQGCMADTDCVDKICMSMKCAAAGCNDGKENGAETDVDCGGPIPKCPTRCPTGKKCSNGPDCIGGLCVGMICQPTCTDTVKNQGETDVDCGGVCPSKCNDGQGCVMGTDCTSGVCTNMVCQVPTCVDVVQNQDETDVDCGGAICQGCDVGEKCSQGSDCKEKVCGPDDGGMTCSAPTCSDNVQNQNETDIDCGGMTCVARCNPTQGCLVNSDCKSKVCAAGTCQAATCSDMVQNEDETDIDCGGICATLMPPLKCAAGEMCNIPFDCISNLCVAADGGKVCL